MPRRRRRRDPGAAPAVDAATRADRRHKEMTMAPHAPPLPAPVSGELRMLQGVAGPLAFYEANAGGAAPLLLVHSVNAAASAYEIRPLFEHYRSVRPVQALELPGFGHSERGPRPYSVRMMTDAVLVAARAAADRAGGPVDALAVSLSCEFLARAAGEAPALFRSLALVSPTGFDSRPRKAQQPDGSMGMGWLRRGLEWPVLSEGLFGALTSRTSIRFFLRKTFGSDRVDEGLIDYCYRSAHQPGARHAPYAFVSGFLFSADALDRYLALRQPVWMCHGVRGDFVDYSRKSAVEGRPNWRIQVFETGAMPHFERLAEMVAAYDAFAADLPSSP
jgi:pimeloyl-ACP methyl ester carboxylesterase